MQSIKKKNSPKTYGPISQFYFCSLKSQLVKGSKQTLCTLSPYNRIKLLSKVHIEYIVEATNIILRVVSHIKRQIRYKSKALFFNSTAASQKFKALLSHSEKTMYIAVPVKSGTCEVMRGTTLCLVFSKHLDR